MFAGGSLPRIRAADPCDLKVCISPARSPCSGCWLFCPTLLPLHTAKARQQAQQQVRDEVFNSPPHTDFGEQGCICASTATVYVDSTSTVASLPAPSSPPPASTSSIYEVTSLPVLTSTPTVGSPSSSLPPTTTPVAPPGGVCGPQAGTSCVSGECCGADGICGSNSTFCGNGCQVQFGNCSRAGRCGGYGDSQSCDDGLCCSDTGYCGQGDDYCGDACQPAFGTCGTNTTSAVNTATSEAGIQFSQVRTSRNILTRARQAAHVL